MKALYSYNLDPRKTFLLKDQTLEEVLRVLHKNYPACTFEIDKSFDFEGSFVMKNYDSEKLTVKEYNLNRDVYFERICNFAILDVME